MSNETDKPWLSITEQIAEKLKEGDLDGALKLNDMRKAEEAETPLIDRLPFKDPTILLAAELAGLLPPTQPKPKKK